MPFLPFGLQAYDNTAYGLPPLKLENWYLEEAPERPDRNVRLVPAPGIRSFRKITLPDGLSNPGRGVFQNDGVSSGRLLTIHGNIGFLTTSTGVSSQVSGSLSVDDLDEPAIFAVSQTPQLVFVSGGQAYELIADSQFQSFTWDGLSGADTIDVVVINQRHVYIERNSGRAWFSDRGDAQTVQATAFITAESNPDLLRAALVYRGDLVLFGTRTIEFYFDTGDTDVPFSRRSGFVIEKGIIGTHAKVKANFSLYFVGEDEVVYQFRGGLPSKVSTTPIDRLIQGLTDDQKRRIRLTTYDQNGVTWVKLHLPETGDYLLDTQKGLWSRRLRLSDAEYKIDYFVAAFGQTFAQDLDDGGLVILDPQYFLDQNSPIVRTAAAIVAIDDGRPNISNIVIDGQSGIALDGNQLGSDPQIMLRKSRDGVLFNNTVQRPFGKIGQYGFRTVFTGLGDIKPPIALFEMSISDPVGAAIYGAQYNVNTP